MTANEIKIIKKLHLKKYRKEEQKYFVEGQKLFNEALTNSPELIEKVFYTNSSEQPDNAISSERISEKEMSRITALKNPSPIFVLMKMNPSKGGTAERSLYLEDLKDPGNMGTIIRTADWFGIEKIYLSKECVDIYNPKVIQSTMGSFFRADFEECSPEKIQEKGIPLLGATLKGTPCSDSTFPNSFCLVIGNESKGINDDTLSILDQEVFIPGKGKAESLNASVAAGILLFAINQ